LSEVCCVCGQVCIESAPPPWEERWSWGPDGLHCHFRCEAEFRKLGLRELHRRVARRAARA
jgi:hypothetical protein